MNSRIKNFDLIPPSRSCRRAFGAVVAAFYLASGAIGQATSGAIVIRTIAEKETKVMESGHEVRKLVPADRVGPGDQVIYTLEVRNTGTRVEPPPTVTNPIPEHMRYIERSAVGPGAEVSYSVDGGHVFDRSENLQVLGVDGRLRAATAADYTHVRWQMRSSLKPKSVAFARFRAVVK